MNAKRYARLLVAMVLLLSLAAGLTHAQRPGPEGTLSPQAALGTAFTYQGRLEDASGPVDSTCDFRFILHGSSNGADQIGVPQPKTNVPVSNGYFTVDDLDFGAIAFTGQERWLGIELRCPAGTGAYTTLSPRQPLTATPYALYALNVATHNHLGQTWSGSNNPLVINGSFSRSPNNAPLVLGNSHSSGDGLRVMSAGRDGVYVDSADYGLHVSSVDDDGVYVTSAGGDGVAVASAGDDGLYVHSAGDDGVQVRKAGNPSTMTNPSNHHNGFEVAGAEGSGLYVGQADDNGVHVSRADRTGVYVNSAGDEGLWVTSAGNNGVLVDVAGDHGVYVNVAGDDGVFVNAAGDDGVDIGSAGDRGVSVGSAEYGLVVDTANYGVIVTSADSDGVVVTSAGDDGVVVNSAGGDGVYVSSAGGDGVVVSSAGGDGVQVSADLDGVFVAAGYHGVAVNSAGHNGLDVHYAGEDGLHVSSAGDDGVYVGAVGDYGAYFNGTVYATFFAGPGASSRIDHPLDPENLYLSHSFVGSPDMMNIYNGNVALDAAGEAWVELPAWFEALNQNFRYQLTPIGAPGPDLYIAEEVRDNRFKIAGGAAGMRVSWQVTGIRHDPYAEARRVPVERDKPPQERGTYLSPEAYGLPETMGLAYRKDQTAGDRAAASGR